MASDRCLLLTDYRSLVTGYMVTARRPRPRGQTIDKRLIKYTLSI